MSPVDQVKELIDEMDAQEFEDVLLHMASKARQVNADNHGAEDPAWDDASRWLSLAWTAVQERRAN